MGGGGGGGGGRGRPKDYRNTQNFGNPLPVYPPLTDPPVIVVRSMANRHVHLAELRSRSTRVDIGKPKTTNPLAQGVLSQFISSLARASQGEETPTIPYAKYRNTQMYRRSRPCLSSAFVLPTYE